MGTFTLAARVLLALVFALTGIAKLPDPSGSRQTFSEFGAGDRLARLGAVALAPAELIVAAGLVFVPTARWAGIGAALLLLVFIAGIVAALSHGRRPDCGCFGAWRPTPIGREKLVRNGILLILALFVAASGPGPAVNRWVTTHSAGAVLAAGVLVLAALVALMLRPVARGAGASQPLTLGTRPVLSAGQTAPAFTLSDAQGDARELRSLSPSGLPLVLIFATTTCGSCVKLFPHLARWETTLAERLRIAVIMRADAAAAQQIAEQYRLATVLADPDGTAVNSYGIAATPAGFALSSSGRVLSGPALGQEAIENLLRLTLHLEAPIPTPWTQTTNAA